MATTSYDYNDPNSTPPANSGQIRQAIARRFTRGSPNAPEVDDEPGPTNPLGQLRDPSAAAQATAGAASPQGSPQAIAANAPPYSNPDPTSGGMVPVVSPGFGSTIGSAIASGVRSLVGMQSRLSNPSTTTDAPTPAPRQAIAASGPSGVPYDDASPVGPSSPATIAAPVSNLPQGITRTGNAYTGTQQATAALPADGMTDAQRNNAPFASQLASLDARDQANDAMQAQRQQQGQRLAQLQANDYDARVAAQKASRDADVANFNLSVGGIGTRRSALARIATGAQIANEAAQGRLSTARSALATLPQTDYLGDVAKTQGIVNAAAQAPLTQAEGTQRLAAGAQQLQLGQYTVQQAQRTQAAVDALHNAKTPEEVEQARQNLLVMQGKNPSEWDVKTVGGRVVVAPDGSSTIVGGYGVAINHLTGKSFLIPPPSQAELDNKTTPPPQPAIDHLRKNPATRDQFDERFGAGASARYLGQ